MSQAQGTKFHSTNTIRHQLTDYWQVTSVSQLRQLAGDINKREIKHGNTEAQWHQRWPVPWKFLWNRAQIVTQSKSQLKQRCEQLATETWQNECKQTSNKPFPSSRVQSTSQWVQWKLANRSEAFRWMLALNIHVRLTYLVSLAIGSCLPILRGIPEHWQ